MVALLLLAASAWGSTSAKVPKGAVGGSYGTGAPFLTWASIGPISVDGVSNGRDGLVAVIAGAITLGGLLLGRPKAAEATTRRVSGFSPTGEKVASDQ